MTSRQPKRIINGCAVILFLFTLGSQLTVSGADFAPAKFSVPAGFTIELVAGPPLIQHPTLACLDDRGRLFVADNAGVNLSASDLEKQLPNTVRMLEDTNGDGRFDRSTLFADKMTYPMGGAWHNGALYVASPPNIWRLEDTTGDGIADRREILVSQFGYTGNAASIHGCFRGPDGRIYWCDGRHGHEFRDEQGQVTSKLAGSYIFSCKPDGSDVRIHCGGGMDNPVEVDFTPEGEMVGTVNIMFSRPRNDCLVHWLYGGVYPHSERVLQERKRTGALLQAFDDPRWLLMVLMLAREVGDSTTERRLKAIAEQEFGPDFFAEDEDRFAWRFGLDEPHPRGQLNGLLILSEIGPPGAWTNVYNGGHDSQFSLPTVEAVDYPNLGISDASNDTTDGSLRVVTYAATTACRGEPTSWKVTQLPDPKSV